jgi:tetratricopeptide (TPR) repeat protein
MLDALRVVTEQRPRPLSEAFRGTRSLDTDVATICHKALELAPEDRYASAAALSEDVGRWLSDLPIQARPPSTMYQLRKFVARKKAMSAFVGTIALLLVGLAVTMSVLRGEAERARGEAQAAVDRLEVARADLETVVDFQARMLSDLDAETFGRNLFQGLRTRLGDALEGEPDRDAALASIDSRLQLLNPTDVALGVLEEEILTRAEEAVAAEFAERPEVRGRLELSLGRTAFELGLYERARRLTQRAVESFDESGAAASAVVARTSIAEVDLYDSEFESAVSESERAIEDGRRVLGPVHPDVLRAVIVEALLYREMSEYAKSESLYVVAAEALSRSLGPEAEETLMAREGVAYNASYQDRVEEAEAAYAELVPAAQRAFGNDDIRTQAFVHDAAQNYVRMERYDEALELYLGALEVGRRTQGSDHSETHVSIVNISRLFARAGRYEEAEAYGRQALEIVERAMAPVSMPAAMSYAVIGDALHGQGRDGEAEAPLTKAYEIFCAMLGPESGGAIVMARKLRDGMASRGLVKEAEVWAARAETEPEE